jgi:hypothetical protein
MKKKNEALLGVAPARAMLVAMAPTAPLLSLIILGDSTRVDLDGYAAGGRVEGRDLDELLVY